MAGDLLISDVFRNGARAVPNRVAAVFGDTSLTFAEIDRRANQLARALSGLGVGYGDRVVLWSATDLDVVPVFAALAKVGAVYAPIGSILGPDEAVGMVTTARPALLVVDGARLSHGALVAARTGVDLACMSRGVDVAKVDKAAVSLATLADAESVEPVDEPRLREVDPHVVFFTSGSTGAPKGVILSHRANFLRTHPGAQLEPRGALVCPFPLFHMGAWTLALQQWQARDAIVFVGPDAAEICAAIEKYHAARLHCLPGIWRRILEYLDTAAGHARDLSSMRLADSATSATPLELLIAIDDALPNARVRVFYGSTEAGNVSSLEPIDVRRKPGSVGVPGSLCETRVGDDGELWARGPLLFDGYFDNPDATADALVDGWYRTGDLVDVDADGYLSVVGRARDVIRTGGETVAPAEVETVLADHPGVVDVAVIGLPDARWGEVVCAVVVAADAAAPTLDSLREHCGDRLARFKHPRRLELVDEIPRTPATRQVQRRLLVERYG